MQPAAVPVATCGGGSWRVKDMRWGAEDEVVEIPAREAAPTADSEAARVVRTAGAAPTADPGAAGAAQANRAAGGAPTADTGAAGAAPTADTGAAAAAPMAAAMGGPVVEVPAERGPLPGSSSHRGPPPGCSAEANGGAGTTTNAGKGSGALRCIGRTGKGPRPAGTIARSPGTPAAPSGTSAGSRRKSANAGSAGRTRTEANRSIGVGSTSAKVQPEARTASLTRPRRTTGCRATRVPRRRKCSKPLRKPALRRELRLPVAPRRELWREWWSASLRRELLRTAARCAEPTQEAGATREAGAEVASRWPAVALASQLCAMGVRAEHLQRHWRKTPTDT